jgi:hypothetical protein
MRDLYWWRAPNMRNLTQQKYRPPIHRKINRYSRRRERRISSSRSFCVKLVKLGLKNKI